MASTWIENYIRDVVRELQYDMCVDGKPVIIGPAFGISVTHEPGFGKPDDADGRQAPPARSTSATLHEPLPRNALHPRRRTDALLGPLNHWPLS
jgi:hypothetical protein